MDSVEHSDNAPDVSSRAAVNGNDATLDDTVVESLKSLGAGDLLALEILVEKILICLGDRLVERFLILNGDVAEVNVGFNLRQPGGFHSIFIMYGTPRIAKDTRVYNAIRGAKTKKSVEDVQMKVMAKHLKFGGSE